MSSGHDARYRWTNRAAALGLLLWALVPGWAHAQGKGHGVEARAVSPALTEIAPGGIVTLSFRVTSRTDQEEEFLESLSLPQGWQPITPASSFVLARAISQVRLIAFAVPRSAPAASYTVTYAVRSQRDYAIQDADSVTVSVLPAGKLDLLLEEKPDTVLAGDDYQAKVRLLNRGNSTLKVGLRVNGETGLLARVEPAKVELAPGRSSVVVVSVRTDKREKHRGTRYLSLTAEVGEAKGRLTASITIGTEVIPRVEEEEEEEDTYRRLPAAVSIRMNGSGREAAVQVEFAGAGVLDDAGRRQLAFLFRGPDTQERGVFGLRDEYWLSYSAPELGLQLGDQSYGLSRLTDYYRYGRGFAVDVKPGQSGLGFGAFYVGSRWGSPAQKETGFYLADRAGGNLDLKLNVLSREQSASVLTPELHDTAPWMGRWREW